MISRTLFCASLLLGFAGLAVVGGCGSSSPESNKADEASKMQLATKARAYFDGVHGDYNALSATDKAEYVKSMGGEKPATDLWNQMKGSGAPRASAATTGGVPGVTTGPR